MGVRAYKAESHETTSACDVVTSQTYNDAVR